MSVSVICVFSVKKSVKLRIFLKFYCIEYLSSSRRICWAHLTMAGIKGIANIHDKSNHFGIPVSCLTWSGRSLWKSSLYFAKWLIFIYKYFYDIIDQRWYIIFIFSCNLHFMAALANRVSQRPMFLGEFGDGKRFPWSLC